MNKLLFWVKYSKVLLLLFCLFDTQSLWGQGQSDSIFGKPLIVLRVDDPWHGVAGSGAPVFALYEKGQILYSVEKNEKLKIYKVTLGQKELADVIQSLVTDSLYNLESRYDLDVGTDQPDNTLTLNLNKQKTILVYGSLRLSEVRRNTPKSFLNVYDKITKYRHPLAKEWLPEKIEVEFVGYGIAPRKRAWIKGFPDLNSTSTIKVHDDLYKVTIIKDQYGQFFKYYFSLREREAVEINNRKMSIAYTLRYPNIK